MPSEDQIKTYRNPTPTTDVIIPMKKNGRDGIVLVKRRNAPHGYALPGGFHEYGLTAAENAKKEAMEETNLDVLIEDGNHPYSVWTNPLRDPRVHTMSTVYIARPSNPSAKPLGGDDADPDGTGIYTIDEVVDMAHKGMIPFDHEHIIMDYLKRENLYTPKKIVKAGAVVRCKPLHHGGVNLLESMCEIAEHVVIGIGSSNMYDVRNPFFADESRAMIDLVLSQNYDNYSFKDIPDYGHIPEFADGQRWKQEILEQFGVLDMFVSGNRYTIDLLKDTYNVVLPQDIIPQERWINSKGSGVRYEMARNGDWEILVPDVVSSYIIQNGLDERFRDKFGKQTIEYFEDKNPFMNETLQEEKSKINFS